MSCLPSHISMPMVGMIIDVLFFLGGLLSYMFPSHSYISNPTSSNAGRWNRGMSYLLSLVVLAGGTAACPVGRSKADGKKILFNGNQCWAALIKVKAAYDKLEGHPRVS